MSKLKIVVNKQQTNKEADYDYKNIDGFL